MLNFYGRERWEDLKKPYYRMCNDKENRIKKIIASSIGEIANILKDNTVEDQLIIVFDRFFNDDSKIHL